jgi:glycosyltransferase involved in cell wall biosynthesis
MTLSIITVVRNGAATIRDCLESVRRQSVAAEHIVVDGQSADCTVEIVRDCARPGLGVISEPDEGIYDAMSKGIARTRGDVIGILNADDFYASGDVLRKVAALFEDAAVDSCYGDLLYVKSQVDQERGASPPPGSLAAERWRYEFQGVPNISAPSERVSESRAGFQPAPLPRNAAVRLQPQPIAEARPHLLLRDQQPEGCVPAAVCLAGGPRGSDAEEVLAGRFTGVFNLQEVNGAFALPGERVVRHWKAGHMTERSFHWGWMPPHPTFFARRAAYERAGPFRLDLGTAADYEMMLRLLVKERITVRYLAEVLVKMRAGGVSNCSLTNRLHAHRNDRRAWDVNGLRPYPWTLWLKPLRKVLQWV